jgi:hypothetical protein
MFIRRTSVSEIPKDAEGCANWVHELYQKKDKVYDYFADNDTFEGNGLPRIEIPRNYYDLLIEIAWMLIIGVPTILYLFKFLWTSSLITQLIFLIIIILGNYT